MKITSLLLLSPLAVLAAPAVEERQSSTSLDALMKAKGKLYFGTCSDQNRLTTGKSAAVIQQDFGQVTPENSMKWDATEPSNNGFNFAGADYLVNWAVQNNKTIRGHTLCWHSQLPSWVSSIQDKAQLTTVLQRHITTVMTRYKGKIRAWVSNYSQSQQPVHGGEMLTHASSLRRTCATRSSTKMALCDLLSSLRSWEKTSFRSPTKPPVRPTPMRFYISTIITWTAQRTPR